MGAKSVPKAFGEVLREYRTKAGLSQEELALAADIDRSYISMLERGIRQPSLEMVFKVAAVLKVTPATMVAKTASIVTIQTK